MLNKFELTVDRQTADRHVWNITFPQTKFAGGNIGKSKTFAN